MVDLHGRFSDDDIDFYSRFIFWVAQPFLIFSLTRHTVSLLQPVRLNNIKPNI